MITSGTILIAQDTLRPQFFQAENEPCPNTWMSVAHHLNPHDLEKELSISGWTFFFMAGTIRTMAFGFDRAKMMHRAIERLITNVKLQNCNCLVIDGVAANSFLGMPYITVSAHSRQIQKGTVFSH